MRFGDYEANLSPAGLARGWLESCVCRAGTLKLTFMAGRFKMIFLTAYHFAADGTALPEAQAAGTKP